MIRYVIIDDEFMAHDIIKGYCDLLPSMQLMKRCYDALEAFEYLNQQEVELIFLDLHMPVLKGFDLLKLLKHTPRVIVTTAHKEYALDGYDFNISDYLLKPFGFERLLKAINKAFGSLPAQVAVRHEGRDLNNRLFLLSNKKYMQVKTSAILFLEATGNYTKVVCDNGTLLVREKISALLELLPTNEFIQVHKSFAVASAHIESIEGRRIAIGKHIIPIGDTYKGRVADLLR